MHTKELLDAVLADLDDLKASDVCPLDVHQLTSLTDYMVIASGSSSRHVRSIAENLVEKMRTRVVIPIGIEGDAGDEWVLVDLGDIVVHIMQPSTRDFYQLEKLWSPMLQQANTVAIA